MIALYIVVCMEVQRLETNPASARVQKIGLEVIFVQALLWWEAPMLGKNLEYLKDWMSELELVSA